jgi:hypothetical protein
VARDAGLLGALGAALVLASSSASASASTASSLEIAHWNGTVWTRLATPHLSGGLSAVTAISTSEAWAVGDAAGRPLALHWTGGSWRRVATPAPVQSGNGLLAAVSASSSQDVWAVGYWRRRTLIEHWNGERWTHVLSPSGASAGYLRGVSALSPTDAWAVGSQGKATLVLHWNGRRWSRVPSPNPGPAAGRADTLSAVSGAWAVGSYSFERADGAGNRRTLVLHWNGKRWTSVASPNSPPLRHGNALVAVAAPGHAAWAVGSHGTGRGRAPLAESWNRHSWHVVATPAWSGATCCTNGLEQVVADRSGNIWTAGYYSDVHMAFVPFVDRWDGSAWKRFPVGAAIRNGFVTGIAATSADDVWVVANRPPAQGLR